jgi:hypothetical protein
VLPSAETAAMLFWALLASGQINMREVDGWQTFSTKPIDEQIHRSLKRYLHVTGDRATPNSNRFPDATCRLEVELSELLREGGEF